MTPKRAISSLERINAQASAQSEHEEERDEDEEDDDEQQEATPTSSTRFPIQKVVRKQVT